MFRATHSFQRRLTLPRPSNTGMKAMALSPFRGSQLIISCAAIWLNTFCQGFSSMSVQSHKPIPITVISGFLGSGKTTLLQNLLENNEGLRIAVIVNDVASVNIDSKLIAGQSSAAGMVELQNGCACCSLSEELLASVSELVTLSDMRGDDEGFQHIVIELSGVADPKSVRAKFQEAVLYDMPMMERVRLDTMVTLIDTSTFLDHLKSGKTASPDETPELFYREGEEPPAAQEEQEWMKDMPGPLLEALMAGDRAYSGAEPGAADNGVADLLVSQTETSDLVLLNKVDLVEDPDVLTRIEDIVNALNPRATTMRTKFGKIPLRSVLGAAGGMGAVEAGVVDDHRDAVQAAVSEHRHEEHSSHSHNDDCADPECEDSSHSHTHDHDCNEPDCTDASHSHAQEEQCEDAACTDPSHDHSHDSASHSHAQEQQCEDAACTDPSHDHSHGSHDHAHAHGGIGTFVYRARRPFHPGRLVSFLRYLPVSRGLPPVGEDEPQLTISKSTQETMQLVLRSKGFTWCADSNVAAMFLSHAGSSVELSCLGRWWSTLSRQQWPLEATSAILEDFDVVSHDEEDPASTTVGDRRQELVFIGQSLGRSDCQKAIGEALDQCLLDDGEWSIFQVQKSDENALQATFASASAMKPKVMSY